MQNAEDEEDASKVAERKAEAARIRALNAVYMKDLREGKMVQKRVAQPKKTARP
jgi:hypothetical protein